MRKGQLVTRLIAFIKYVIVILLVLVTLSLLWAEKSYGNIGFDEVIFHLNIPKQGLSQDILESYMKAALVPTVLFILVIFLARMLYSILQKKGYGLDIGYELECIIFGHKVSGKTQRNILYLMMIITWIILIVSRADKTFGFIEWAQNMLQQSDFIENEYRDPAKLELIFPEERRNLICIFVESGETSAQDIENGGLFEDNYIPELTQLAADNVSFSHSEKLEGACVAPCCGWTIAGLVAETSGIPLKLYGVGRNIDNSMDEYEYFLPGAVTLGDVLHDEGYTNYFMVGSEFSFGGREKYFTSHGNYDFWDYYTAIEKGKIASNYRVWWGYEDKKLFEYAKEKLNELGKGEKPFNFSILTVDTHQEDGYVCELCEDNWEGQYANVWSCASKQIYEFVEWIKEQDFYENTTIVIIGDHCSMDADFYDDVTMNKHHGSIERKVYNAFINPAVEPINEKNRMFTTLDFFPTTLASLGVEIEGNRLGLGVNLFSDEPTLPEIYGYEYMFEELEKKSHFYDYELLYK